MTRTFNLSGTPRGEGYPRSDVGGGDRPRGARRGDRMIVEQAKGILMYSHGLTADAAYEVLQHFSMHNEATIGKIAADLARAAASGIIDAGTRTEIDRLLVNWSPRLSRRPRG